MKAGWKEIRLGDYITDIAAGPFGSNLKVECFVESGFPIIDGANLKGFRVTDNITKFVTNEKARSLHRSIAKRNDVIVTISGTVGQIAYIPANSEYEEYLCSQRQFRASFDESKVNVPYLVYYFHSYQGQQKILSFANQVGVPALAQPLKNFREILMLLPPLATQRRIAAVLGALDDKIELNRKMNANLEAQAQALFKSWFVDFEPFGGKMPKEWKMGTLGEVANYYAGTIDAGELSAGNYFSTENMVVNKGGVVDSSSVPNEGCVPECLEGCVLVSNIRPYFKKIFRVASRGGHSHDVLCFKAMDSIYDWYLYQMLFDDCFFDHMMAGAKGTKMPRGDKRQILKYACAIPPKEVVLSFNKRIDPMCRLIAVNAAESRKLAETRDALLPKLMSGELEVA